MFQSCKSIEEAGFTGFQTIERLWRDHSILPDKPGVYVILHPENASVSYMTQGVGGFFKRRNPNIAVEQLQSRWIDDCAVLYIGQAGGNGSTSTIKKRIKQYLDFGKSLPVGHYGGRYIWQLSHHPQLIVACKEIKGADARLEEKLLLTEFVNYYGRLPFANINR
ncbi:MAG: hypothetical protein EOO01_44555 [Chitinophagaceae bacterium]|nr:MAG: hypothetical protein EOO01_44555 [Chitinophagaceae bacterium]